MHQSTIQAGVSSACFYPQETIHAVRKLAEQKIANIEIFFNAPRELKEEYVEQLAQLCERAGTRVVSIHPFTSNSEPLYFFSEYPGRFEDGLEIYRYFFRAAKRLGAKLLVFHGDSPANKTPLKVGFENVKRLDFFAQEEFGIRVAYENVVRCRGKEPHYFERLLDYYPQMNFVLDVKQALRSGQDPLEYIRRLGSSITHIHISDSSAERDCLPIGQGTMDIAQFVKLLRANQFDGCLIQELYSQSYQSEQEIYRSYEQLKAVIFNL